MSANQETEGTIDSEDLLRKVYRPKETVIIGFLFVAATIAVVVTALIIYTLMEGSLSFFTAEEVDAWSFFTGTEWVPSGTNPRFGILALLSGTALIAGGALLIAGPIGIGAAIYLSEFAEPKMRRRVKPMVEILAGIPSIVYGFFALLIISPILQEHFGASYFNAASAIVVIAVMILPIIVSISDDAMRAVPYEIKEAARGLGTTKWETATRVVMPSASSGIAASILLALARALGETMVVVLAAGSVSRFSLDPLGEVMTMTTYIAQVATGDIPPGTAVDAAFAVGLVLFLITYSINTIAAGIVKRVHTGGKVKIKESYRWDRAVEWIQTKLGMDRMDPIGPAEKELIETKWLHRRYLVEKVGRTVMGSCLVMAVIFLIYLSWSVLEQGWHQIDGTFLTSYPSWKPEKAGIKPVIIGSIYLILLTVVFAVPSGVGAAIYLNEFARDTASTRLLRRMIQNLAGVPSIVFGLVGLHVFSRLLGFGLSLLTGALTLAIMILPVIVVTTEEALKSVPLNFREAALGVGATRWQAVRHHVLPNALPGIATGVVLSISRAIGETAPILFIASVFSKTPPSGVMDGFLALPITIFYWTKHPKEEFHELAAATIIVLFVILLILNSVAIFIRNRAEAKREW